MTKKRPQGDYTSPNGLELWALRRGSSSLHAPRRRDSGTETLKRETE